MKLDIQDEAWSSNPFLRFIWLQDYSSALCQITHGNPRTFSSMINVGH